LTRDIDFYVRRPRVKSQQRVIPRDFEAGAKSQRRIPRRYRGAFIYRPRSEWSRMR